METKKIILVLLLASTLFSCKSHHEIEYLASEIVNSTKANIDSIFENNRPITSFFLDTIINGQKPSIYFSKVNDEYFNGDFEILRTHGFFPKYYFKNDFEGNHISIIMKKKNKMNKIITFSFIKKENEFWTLNEIKIEDGFDFNLKNFN